MKSENLQRAIGCALWALASGAGAQKSTTGAPADSTSGGRVEEVVVTATRRAENLQEVPLAITAITAEKLSEAGITNTIQIANQTPGLVMHQQVGAMEAFIRGVGSKDATAGQEPSVATFIDGVYVPSAYGAIFSLNNVERVEVLKGPQGTLFGRNATGGAIQIITKTPSDTPSGTASVSYGNYDTIEGKFYGTTGLGSKVAADLAVYHHDPGDPVGRNSTTGGDQARTVETAIRNKWLFTPSDATRVTIAGGYFKAEYHGLGAGRQLFPGSVAIDGTERYTGDFYDISGNVDANTRVRSYDGMLQIEHDLQRFSLKSITAYRDMSVRQPFDNDFTEAPIIDVYIDDQRYKTFTQEVQALSDPSSKIKWIVGMFYMHDKSGFGGPQGLGLYGAGIGLPPPLGVGIHNKITTDSYAGFGEATLPLSEFTNLTVGARYTKDKRELSGYTDVLTDPDTRTVIATTPISPEPDKSFSKTTFRAILDHRFVEGLMGYASFSRGFKAGNFNTVSSTDPPFKPEELDAYQIGVKSDLLKGRLRLNIDAYRYKYKEIQLPVSNGPTISTINAAKATIHGVELAGTVVATNQFTIDFGANWLKAEFDSFPNAPCFLPASVGTAVPCGKANVATDCVPTLPTPTAVQYSCNLADNRLPNTPKFTANLAPTYTLDSSIGRFTGSVGYSYTDSFYWESSNTLKQDSYSLVNAQIRWVDRREAWGVKLFAANLTDKKYVVFGQTGLNGYSLAAGSPRTYGVEISYTF